MALTIPAWSALEPSQNVDGGLDQVTGGICERTQQVRDALVAAVQANNAAVTDCSLVTEAHLDRITRSRSASWMTKASRRSSPGTSQAWADVLDPRSG